MYRNTCKPMTAWNGRKKLCSLHLNNLWLGSWHLYSHWYSSLKTTNLVTKMILIKKNMELFIISCVRFMFTLGTRSILDLWSYILLKALHCIACEKKLTYYTSSLYKNMSEWHTLECHFSKSGPGSRSESQKDLKPSSNYCKITLQSY